MIYNTLRKLPKVLQIEILETGDLTLLSDEGTPLEELQLLWIDLMEEFKARYDSKNQSKVFNIYKEIDFLERKYDIINCAVDALSFDIHPELIAMLQDYGYTLTDANYNNDLERIQRESKGIVQKINLFKNQLPKRDESQESQSNSIVDLMASYSSIIGYDFDYYSISVEKFHALEKQVKQKIAFIEKQNQNLKNSK